MIKTFLRGQHFKNVSGFTIHILYHIGRIIVGVFASSVVDRGFEHWSGQTKNYNIGICRFSNKHTALSSKSQKWSAQN